MVIIITLLTLLGAYLRLSGLSLYTFSPDDLLHIYISQNDLLHLFLANSQSTNAPLPYLLLQFFYSLGLPVSTSRLISLVPGLLLIPLSYLLGKAYFNRLSGLFLAFMVAFGLFPVLISQPVRQYALYLLFQALALIYFRHLQIKFSHPSLYIYIFYSSLALLAQHSALLPISIIFFYSLSVFRSHRKFILLIHLIPLAIFTFSALYQGLATWHASDHYRLAVSGWLITGFPSSLSGILLQFRHLFVYYSPPVFGFWLLTSTLFLLSLYLLLRQRNFFLVFFSISSLITTILLALFKIYPFSATRHTVHLYWPLLLLTSATFSRLRFHFLPPILIQTLSLTLPLFIFSLLSPHLYRLPSDFPLTNSDLQDFHSLIEKNLTGNSAIIADRQAGLYLLFPPTRPTYHYIIPSTVQTTYHKYPLIYSNSWPAQFTANQLRTGLSTLSSYFPSRLFIIQAGWEINELPQSLSQSGLTPFITNSYSKSTGNWGYIIYILDLPENYDYSPQFQI